MSTNKPKFTACLVHEQDKDRIKELRTKLNLTEKDTMTLLLDAAESHLEEMQQRAAAINKQSEEQKEARRKAKQEENKEAQKMARKLIAAGKVKKGDQSSESTEQDASEPSIE